MKVSIAEIKVTDRLRKEPGNVADLAESFKRFGQLQPIILDDDKSLVAGFRRLTAAKLAGWTEIDATFRSQMTDVERREIELEENIQRLDMGWFEEQEAIAEIHRLKCLRNPNWSQDMTAAIVGADGRGHSEVSHAIKIVKLAKLFPELKDAKSLLQAQSWAQAKVASVVRLKEVKDNPAEFKAIEERIWLGDSVEVIKQLPSGLLRLVLTDPPFGIDYDRRKAGTEQAPTAYQDDKKSYERLLGMAADLHRVLKPDGWLVWFLGPTWYERAKLAFREAGFTVDEMPIIWDRSDGRGYTARPDRYFTRVYDMALHCLKGNPEMPAYGRGKPNLLRYPPVEDRDLLVERPVELYQELIRRLTLEGESVADFFVGSGSVLAAAASLKREYWGCELDSERRAVAIKKVKAHTP